MWLSLPPDTTDDSLIWVIDGSRKHAETWETATTGCGAAVIKCDGTLVAYAHATPPPWVRTASAAEAWALKLVVSVCPFVPKILTDCMALVNAAQAGVQASTAASRVTARIWNDMSYCLDGDFNHLRGMLVWLPAHTACETIGSRCKSDGTLVRVAEWRANQLADSLAKRGAETSAFRSEVSGLIADAKLALQCSAAQLGIVTHAANNHKEQVVLADGSSKCVCVCKRDSSARPPPSRIPGRGEKHLSPQESLASRH